MITTAVIIQPTHSLTLSLSLSQALETGVRICKGHWYSHGIELRQSRRLHAELSWPPPRSRLASLTRNSNISKQTILWAKFNYAQVSEPISQCITNYSLHTLSVCSHNNRFQNVYAEMKTVSRLGEEEPSMFSNKKEMIYLLVRNKHLNIALEGEDTMPRRLEVKSDCFVVQFILIVGSRIVSSLRNY